ncbi:MAG: hypothetical protein FJ293_00760 [Planctomycetes bacterium]|nr:hypothetical protein [Planctomycetota bacterium]
MATSSLVMLAGLLLPAVRTWRHWSLEHQAMEEMARISAGIHQFMADTGLTPTRARNGDPRGAMRLLGPGLIAEGAYYYPDRHQSGLQEHLVENSPQGRQQPGYGGWNGPYVTPLTADPWGFAYVLIAYPLARADDRDCVLVSAGPNRRMDGTYASPRDVIAAGDDLVYVVVDKSRSAAAPLR